LGFTRRCGVADILIAWYIGADAENCGSVS